MNNNITSLQKGMFRDCSPEQQPKSTYRYALNGILNNDKGNAISAEHSYSYNKIIDDVENIKVLGNVYIGNNDTVLFIGGDVNRILIYNPDKATKILIDTLDLNFHKLIDSVYRLRRGCERVIYFTDGLNSPRLIDIDRLEKYKTNNEWDINKMKLFKTYNSIPYFNNFSVVENGELPAGSYNFSIQYLDEDLNPTEWISISDTIIIFNDSEKSNSFSEIRGSTNKKLEYQNFGITNKSIRMEIENLDTSFLFYRIAIIEANSGNGRVNNIIYSQEISTKQKVFIYTHSRGFIKGTEEEIQQFNSIIDTAENIEQIENRLILGNVKGKQVNFCKLQKYASKIGSYGILQEIELNDIKDPNNLKNSCVHTNKTGYMPGEIYSFGIVYIFKDNTLSPVYHIPGRSNSTLNLKSSESNKYNEGNFELSINNTLENTHYTDNNSCEDYWGKDIDGNILKGEKVRHHRFPFRSEIRQPLYYKQFDFKKDFLNNSEKYVNYFHYDFTVFSPYLTLKSSYEFIADIEYRLDGVRKHIIKKFSYNFTKEINIFLFYSDEIPSNVIIKMEWNLPYYWSEDEQKEEAYYKATSNNYKIITRKKDDILLEGSGIDIVNMDIFYKSKIFGIRFFNIEKPKDIGEEIIGYYIVRNERTEEEKTILDSGVMLPTVKSSDKSKNYVSHSLLSPVFKYDDDKIKNDVFSLIHPENKFNNKEYTNVTDLFIEGFFEKISTNKLTGILQDVQPGTSYNKKTDATSEKDNDGIDLHVLNRNTNLKYIEYNGNYQIQPKEIFYLNTLFSKTISDLNEERKDIYNLSADNKIGIGTLSNNNDKPSFLPKYKKFVVSKEDLLTYFKKNRYPYVKLVRNLSNPYNSFRILPYYREHQKPFYFDNNNQTDIFNGDSYISSMKYNSSMFYDVRGRKRKDKSQFVRFFVGAAAIIGGTILTATGAGAGAGLSLIGAGITQIAIGFTKLQASKVYGDLYDDGLDSTVDDDDTKEIFDKNPQDDEIQWFFDTLSNLWFESSVNINWRMGLTVGIPDFINSPTGYTGQQMLQYCFDKLTIPDSKNDNNRNYQGFCNAEIYQINPDYVRTEKQKKHYHLALEYDCCSKCRETFPNRIHWSEQSFQEELTDNYRQFLPNNYKDIEGKFGKITNLFRIKNNLFIHTEEALFHIPQNIQERITNDIVSFIGTGSFFSIPPRLILDDENGNSAGTNHRLGTVKTPYGVYFFAEKQGIIYQFTGQKLLPISSKGMYYFFKDNIPINLQNANFLSCYDTENERLFFSKVTNEKDWTISYSLKQNCWVSFHKHYLPEYYFTIPNQFFYIVNDNIYKINKNSVSTPFIIEFISLSNPLITRTWDNLKFISDSRPMYNNDVKDVFFDKYLLYNNNQCTGINRFIQKTWNSTDFNLSNNEKTWSFNNFRDYVNDYTKPVINKNIVPYAKTKEYFNINNINYNKDWKDLQLFRDKYLGIRLISCNTNYLLTLYYSVEEERPSFK